MVGRPFCLYNQPQHWSYFFVTLRWFGAGPIYHKYKNLGIRVASRVAELLKICNLGKLRKNRKISNLGRDIA